MDLLYKYYSTENEYAINNIENGNICFSPIESLNDPFEGVGAYLYEVSREEQDYWNSIGSDVPKLISKRFSEDVRDVVNFQYRVFCATKKCDNPLLWAYYANSHKGFCVGYKKENISKVSSNIFDIEYISQMCSINDLDVNTYIKLLKVKSTDWKHENECRVIYQLNDSDVSALKPNVYLDEESQCKEKMYKLCGYVQTNNLRTLCANKFIIKKCEPEVIYMGMRMEWEHKQKLINVAKKFNIRVFQMTQKQNDFNIVPEEIIFNL